MEAWNIDNGSAMHPGGKPIRLPANHHNSKSCWQTPDVCFQISIIRTSHMFVSISGWSMINGKSYMLLQHSICNTYRFTILSDMFTGPSVNATISWGSVPPFSKKHILSHPQICADQNLETVDLFRILYQLKGPVSHCFYVFNHPFDDFQDFASIHSSDRIYLYIYVPTNFSRNLEVLPKNHRSSYTLCSFNIAIKNHHV